MSCVERELRLFRRAVKASKNYPGAIPTAYYRLKRLRWLYRKDAGKFSPRIVERIQKEKRVLPRPIALVVCPSCQGSGTFRWMASYKHTCPRCGGWKKVEKTEATTSENDWIWRK
jgi:ribosomal protein L37AE/L43A